MRITVLGAGLAGVTAAWHLQEDGHEVTVVDRQPQAALETSFANAGLISTGHAFAWASPRAVQVMLKSLFLRDQPLRLRLTPIPRSGAGRCGSSASAPPRARMPTRASSIACAAMPSRSCTT